MNPFTAERVDESNVIVHLPTNMIPLDMQQEAIATLNEEHGFEHWGDHEEKVTFGLLCSTSEKGLEVEFYARAENGAISYIPLDDTY